MLSCRLCKSNNLLFKKKSNLSSSLDSGSFSITDSNYGVTGELYKCNDCGLLQCLSLGDVLKFYCLLEDQGYELSRDERLIQVSAIIHKIKKIKKTGRWLDIGAGSGILVEKALNAGYECIGVEPSFWLQKNAIKRNLPVLPGIFPNNNIVGNFDVISIIDVIEHLNDPVSLLLDIHKQLTSKGILVLTTPDLDSFFANVMKWKWWHFRVAHITYFNKKTLNFMMKKSGFKIVSYSRPIWYFSLSYLIDRINKYLPLFIKIPNFKFTEKIVIPLNLFDSWFIICKKI